MYVSLAMHKFCQASCECWDLDAGSQDLLEQTLAQLRQTVHGRLAEGSINQRLWVNLEGVLHLLPLFEHSMYLLDNNGRHLPPATHLIPEVNVNMA